MRDVKNRLKFSKLVPIFDDDKNVVEKTGPECDRKSILVFVHKSTTDVAPSLRAQQIIRRLS